MKLKEYEHIWAGVVATLEDQGCEGPFPQGEEEVPSWDHEAFRVVNQRAETWPPEVRKVMIEGYTEEGDSPQAQLWWDSWCAWYTTMVEHICAL